MLHALIMFWLSSSTMVVSGLESCSAAGSCMQKQILTAHRIINIHSVHNVALGDY